MKKRNILLAAVLLLCAGVASAQKNFMEGWDGGTAIGVGSEPDEFGWISDAPADDDIWRQADSEEVGTVRYSTTLAKECAIFNTAIDTDFPRYYDQHRLIIIRWDNNGVNYYAYPLKGLQAGINYKFEWMYAWYNNGDQCILRVGINKNTVTTITDNTGADESGEDVSDDLAYQYFFDIEDLLVGPDDGLTYSKKKTVHPGEFEFTVPEDGDYYVTFTCLEVVMDIRSEETGNATGPMAMVGGFNVYDPNASSVTLVEDDNILIHAENGRIRVEGADTYRIVSMSGMQMQPEALLNAGMYIVEVSGKAYKTIVK